MLLFKKTPSHLPLIIFFLFFSMFPTLGFAHGSIGTSFLDGLIHPVLGIDHFLAMIAVGILSAQIGHRAIWTLPSVFVIVVILSMALGLYKYSITFLEFGIITSVIALGFMIVLDRRPRHRMALCIVAFFAFFHGYAHGIEMPILSRPFIFASGMALGTASLHISGVFIGVIAKRYNLKGETFLRYIGSALIGIGFYILFTHFFEVGV